jgi:hypothetical protein
MKRERKQWTWRWRRQFDLKKREKPRRNAVCDGVCRRGLTKDGKSCPALHHDGRKRKAIRFEEKGESKRKCSL